MFYFYLRTGGTGFLGTPSLSLISSTACRTLVLDFRVDETKFWHKLGIRLPPSKKVIHYAQAHEKVLSNYPKTFLQKKEFHFFQMKKIVKESPEAAKNRLYDVLPLYPNNRSIATRMASTKRIFRCRLFESPQRPYCKAH